MLHSILADIYHLGLRILLTPLWRAPVVTLAAALVLRLTRRASAALAAPMAVFAGWLVLTFPDFSLLPHTPLQRLPGAALILALYVYARPTRFIPVILPALAALFAWWLRGTPLGGAPLAATVPWALGLWAALALARRLSAKDTGPATVAAAASLAAALYHSGATSHWCHAAAVPAWAGIALLGLPEAVPALATATILAGMAAISANDRGRFIPADLAGLAPYAVWLLAPRLLPRLNRAGPGLAAALAAIAAVAAIAAGTAALNLR